MLYLQDKYKDDDIGDKIDTKIKEWLDLIKSFDKEKDDIQYRQDLLNTTNDKQERIRIVKEYNKKLNARVFYQIIPSLNYDIYNFKDYRDYTKLWNYDKITNEDFIGYLDTFINNKIDDSNYLDYIYEVKNYVLEKYPSLNDLNINDNYDLNEKNKEFGINYFYFNRIDKDIKSIKYLDKNEKIIKKKLNI